MKVRDVLILMPTIEKVIIERKETGETVAAEFNGLIRRMAALEDVPYLDEEVKGIQLMTDTWHKDYKERGFLRPDIKETVPDVVKGDLHINIYQKIFI